ncbi:MoaD/ThiS family protein [Fulvivirga sp. M361]|uniref:MoaD/ThiS family protein n=1 Tax=Fulvivirga sp. M361 TaxID=2594266 RepID=UPI00117A43A2|nr:MoaD/ThiS family protein [Fulvivirga sp. M361]TRX59410.1 MoaD/ThiS family protein [Fulvivirga sp. M361]
MPNVKFTPNLKRFYPDLDTGQFNGENVAELLDNINQKYSGIKDYIVDEQGELRKHVNIFIGNEMVKDKIKLTDHLSDDDEVYILQALSGG